MQFSVAIHKDEGSVYGVTVPDISGCHSWAKLSIKHWSIRGKQFKAISKHLRISDDGDGPFRSNVINRFGRT